MDWDAEHIAGQVAQRDPDLIVFTYGGNDSRRVAHGKLDREGYAKEFTEAIAYLRAGKPGVACLVTSMTDRGRSLKTEIRSEHVETIVAAQGDAARASGCAFFNMYEAMGGAGSLKRWKDQSPPLAEKDFKHLNHRGRLIVGEWIYQAIMTGYVEHRTRRGR
jgi:lysophospholipase L1-like esterase